MLARCLAVWLALVGTAHAFCRTTTEAPMVSSCPDVCETTGYKLFWTTRELSYSLNARGFPDIDEEDLRSILAESIGAWEDVECKGQSTGLAVIAKDALTQDQVGPLEDEPNDNAIAYLSGEEWEELSLGNAAYATTKVWFDTNSGKIVGADMAFNDAMGPFGECADTGCTREGPRVDLRNVATHEFGHFLGLAHSDVDGSTMYCSAYAADVGKRDLAEDDEQGLCAIFPPGAETKPKKKSGCALGAQTDGSLLALGLLLLLRSPCSSTRTSRRRTRSSRR